MLSEAGRVVCMECVCEMAASSRGRTCLHSGLNHRYFIYEGKTVIFEPALICAYRLVAMKSGAGTTLRVSSWMSQKNEKTSLTYICNPTGQYTNIKLNRTLANSI